MSTKITKQQIFKAAKHIALKGEEPTVANIRAYLNTTGSQTTIHKYLREWKLKCFQSSSINADLEAESTNIAELQQAKQAMETTIAKMSEHNKITSLEFAKTEKLNVELRQELNLLKSQFIVLKQKDQALQMEKEHLARLYQELKDERAVLLAKMERDKDQLIESLRAELKQSHQASLKEISEVSYSGHDLLMQEKVKAINLQEEVKSLNTTVAKLQQELIEATRMMQPLKNQIKWFQKFMAEALTTEQLLAYENQKQLEAFENN